MGIKKALQLLEKQAEIWLVTYRLNGEKAKTPMWFFHENNNLYFITSKSSKKVKYLLRNSNVEVWIGDQPPLVKLQGTARLIFPNSTLFRHYAEKLWRRHPTFYGPFEQRFKYWRENAVIIEVQLIDE